MYSERIEERRKFTKEERQEVLKNSFGICACCGMKLNPKTMTVDHIIPISRGGKNEMKNLIALCCSCNQLKGNLLYMPMGFYSALRNKPRFMEMETYVEDWFKTTCNDFDIEQYPLIAPRTNIQVTFMESHNHKPQPFVRQLLVQWSLVGTKYYDEIEAVTEINIQTIREQMNRAHNKNDDDHPVALYSLRQVTSDKILAVAAISYNKQTKSMAIYLPWHCTHRNNIAYILYNLVQNVIHCIQNIAGYEINAYALLSEQQNSLQEFMKDSLPEDLGYSYRYNVLQNEDGNIMLHIIEINRVPKITITKENLEQAERNLNDSLDK